MLLETVCLKFGLSQVDVNFVIEAVLLDAGLAAITEALGGKMPVGKAFAIASSVCEAVLMEPIGDVAPNTSIERRALNEQHIQRWQQDRLAKQSARREAAAREDARLYQLERLGMVPVDDCGVQELQLAMVS